MIVETTEISAVERLILRGLRLIPPATKGKSWLARRLLPTIRQRGQIEVTLSTGDRLLMSSAQEAIAFHCLIDGVYEPEIAALLETILAPADTFLDIGANVGLFTLLASRIVGKSGSVIAVEASPSINRFLTRNIKISGCSNVHHIAKAVTESGPCILEFWGAPIDKFGMGSLAPQFDAEPIFVEAETIDHILAANAVSIVNVLKIDIEGFEAAAFRGAQELLSREPRPVVIFEFVDWAESRAGFACGEAQRVLIDLGYVLHSIERGGRLKKLERPLEQGAANIAAFPSNVRYPRA